MSLKKINIILYLLIAIFWGGSFIGIKYVVAVWPPVFSAALRVAVSLATITLYFFCLKKNLDVPFSLRWRIWIAGLFSLGIPFSFLFWGERMVSPGLSGIINATMPIWTFIISLIFLGTQNNATPLKIMGLLTGLIGVIIIFYPSVHLPHAHAQILGTLAIFLMAISYAIASVLNQYLFRDGIKVDFYANLYHQHWSALIYLLIASLLFEKWPHWQMLFSWQAFIATLYLAIFSTAMGWFFYYYLIREWGAIRTSTAAYLIPISALLGDFIFFHTIPLLSELIGIAIILPSIILIQFF